MANVELCMPRVKYPGIKVRSNMTKVEQCVSRVMWWITWEPRVVGYKGEVEHD